MADAGYVAVLVIELHFPDAGSLKAKRKDLSSIKAQLRTRFGAAVAETGHQDLWQRSTVVATLAGGSLPVLTEAADHVERWLEDRCPAGVGIDRITVSVDDLRDVVSPSGLGG
jgi:uncharacterized protein YlxP (DUF503 family)